MRYASPLRYPGGKAGLAPFLARVLELNDLVGCPYYEAYAGGAGAALALLGDNTVGEIHLNDVDVRIYSFWRAAIHDTERFVERLLSVPLTIGEWRRQKAVCASPGSHRQFDVGFAAFFLNRCNRSGVLARSGPIGGYDQAGPWRMGVRFSREALAERIVALGRARDRIRVTRQDALEFLSQRLPRGRRRQRVFVYLDPPYIGHGGRLYLNRYQPRDHARMAGYLVRQGRLHWLLSYDDVPLVRSLYATQKVSRLPIRYSLQDKRMASELLIVPEHVALPSVVRAGKQEYRERA